MTILLFPLTYMSMSTLLMKWTKEGCMSIPYGGELGWVFEEVGNSCEGVDDVPTSLVEASGTSTPFFGVVLGR